MALSNYAIGGIVMIFIGIILLIIGVVLLAIDQSNQSVSEWWVWALIVIGVVALIVGIALFFIPEPKTKKSVNSVCGTPSCPKGIALKTKGGCPTRSPSNFAECVQRCEQKFPTLCSQPSRNMYPTVEGDYTSSTPPTPPTPPMSRTDTNILPPPPSSLTRRTPPISTPPPSRETSVRQQVRFPNPPETYESCKRKCESRFSPSRPIASAYSRPVPRRALTNPRRTSGGAPLKRRTDPSLARGGVSSSRFSSSRSIDSPLEIGDSRRRSSSNPTQQEEYSPRPFWRVV